MKQKNNDRRADGPVLGDVKSAEKHETNKGSKKYLLLAANHYASASDAPALCFRLVRIGYTIEAISSVVNTSTIGRDSHSKP